MIIDSHAHVVMPQESYKYFSELVGGRANPYVVPKLSDDQVRKGAEQVIKIMDSVGTDMQFISPRPYLALHSVKPGKVTELWTQHVNDIIGRQALMFPDRIRPVAGLPQHRVEPVELRVVPELRRCVEQWGMVGCIINPDPCEDEEAPPPGMGDEYWHPLYEAMIELDTPGLIHSASGCSPRESYTLKFLNEETIATFHLIQSNIFAKFPDLKIIVAHGGGAVPYQMGRFRSWNTRIGDPVSFDEKMKKLYFDTCNYSKEALEFLIKVVGKDNVLFGTEKPGTGSAFDVTTGRDFDDLKPVIESIDWLSDQDKKDIFECNCRKLYPRAFANLKAK